MSTTTDVLKHFKIVTGPLKAIEVKASDGSRDLFVEGTASSTVQDRQGDQINFTAVAAMAKEAVGLTMFLNHEYNVPEDVFGKCVAATLSNAQDDTFGPCTDMLIRVRVEPSNPRAMAAWEAINNGTKLAFSIGGGLGEYVIRDPKEGEDGNPAFGGQVMEISEIKLYEISLVGIPANQRAYTDNAKRLGVQRQFVEYAIAKAAGIKGASKMKRAIDAGINLLPVAKEVEPEAEPIVEPVVDPDPENPTPEGLITGTDLAASAEIKEVIKAQHPLLALAIDHAREAASNGHLCLECAPKLEKCLGIMNKAFDSAKDIGPEQLAKCMGLLKETTDHGATCGLFHGCLAKCWKCLKNLLPPGFSGDPLDPDSDAESPTDDRVDPTGGPSAPMPPSMDAAPDHTAALQATLDDLTAKIAAATEELDKVLARVSEAQATADALTTQHATKAKEVADLEVKAANLESLRLGRFTKSSAALSKSVPIPIGATREVDDKFVEERRALMQGGDTRRLLADALGSGQVDDPRLRSDG